MQQIITMASFMTDLWESIFTPGPTSTLLKATNVTFGALQIVLLLLLYGTYSIHFVVLSILCAGLWWSINWFAAELILVQEREEKEKLKNEKKDREKDDSDTEVEGSNTIGGNIEKNAVAEVEPVEPKGELKQRGEPFLGTQSSVSTEDEWEKVSENEQDKDK